MTDTDGHSRDAVYSKPSPLTPAVGKMRHAKMQQPHDWPRFSSKSIWRHIVEIDHPQFQQSPQNSHIVCVCDFPRRHMMLETQPLSHPLLCSDGKNGWRSCFTRFHLQENPESEYWLLGIGWYRWVMSSKLGISHLLPT